MFTVEQIDKFIFDNNLIEMPAKKTHEEVMEQDGNDSSSTAASSSDSEHSTPVNTDKQYREVKFYIPESYYEEETDEVQEKTE